MYNERNRNIINCRSLRWSIRRHRRHRIFRHFQSAFEDTSLLRAFGRHRTCRALPADKQHGSGHCIGIIFRSIPHRLVEFAVRSHRAQPDNNVVHSGTVANGSGHVRLSDHSCNAPIHDTHQRKRIGIVPHERFFKKRSNCIHNPIRIGRRGIAPDIDITTVFIFHDTEQQIQTNRKRYNKLIAYYNMYKTT